MWHVNTRYSSVLFLLIHSSMKGEGGGGLILDLGFWLPFWHSRWRVIVAEEFGPKWSHIEHIGLQEKIRPDVKPTYLFLFSILSPIHSNIFLLFPFRILWYLCTYIVFSLPAVGNLFSLRRDKGIFIILSTLLDENNRKGIQSSFTSFFRVLQESKIHTIIIYFTLSCDWIDSFIMLPT